MTTPLKAVAAGGNSAELREWVAGDLLPVSMGGTGGSTAAAARSNLGLGSAAVAEILGTVSQSGGVPTGAIIQRGSNANGEFVRFADGTQICVIVFTGYTATVARNVTFPASFAADAIGVGVSVDASAGWDTDFTFSLSSLSAGAFYSKNTYNNKVRLLLAGRWFS